MNIERILDQQKRLIKALLKERKKNNILEMQNALYCMFLTDEQKKASDQYAKQLIKRGEKNDTT